VLPKKKTSGGQPDDTFPSGCRRWRGFRGKPTSGKVKEKVSVQLVVGKRP